jgi:hypothetical protein
MKASQLLDLFKAQAIAIASLRLGVTPDTTTKQH